MISIKPILNGNKRAVSRAISLIEDESHHASSLLRLLYPHTGKALLIGIVGPPGTGKSSIIDAMVRCYRQRGAHVGVVATDPSSPTSGGALLGDRLRMGSHSLDSDVFIRSMASRGQSGGLSSTTRNVVRVMDSAGMNPIIIETVGAGQNDVSVASVADVVVVVLMPEMGDAVQSSKAGFMEIGDIFVINKTDLDGADKTVSDLRALRSDIQGWEPPILKTVAINGKGIEEMLVKIEDCRQYLEQKGYLVRRRMAHLEEELLGDMVNHWTKKLKLHAKRTSNFKAIVRKVVSREIDPWRATEQLYEELDMM
uniref:LAO/AO transport system ATPase (ArgK) n=1 Tax=uncultured marine thaumarchaeote KM3_55_F05 TaxID=1456198 RepID=A0A075HB15_9ARCH|nr:LAO/AO transport system ATPase (argK) [uncultured marine thaumarchaeote KM3_55_F05]